MTPSKLAPFIPVNDPRFVWFPAAATDVQRTWRRYGWAPIAERIDSNNASEQNAQITPKKSEA